MMTRISTRSFTGLAATTLVLCLAGHTVAWAQASPSSAATQGAGLEEIVVTAQKRTEKLQDVPIAITAIGAEQLQARGITNIASLNSLAPNVQVSSATADTTGTQFSIRGAVTINPALTWDPTVGVYLDGAYLSKGLGSVFDLVDLERIEVLRGPQGTLYGRNTLAGAVNLVTRAPSGRLGGTAEVSYGNYNDIVYKLNLDLPRLGIASLSLGARGERRDGVTRTTPGSSVSELDNRHQDAGRLALDLDFSDTFQAAYRLDLSNVDQQPMHSYLYRALIPALAPWVTQSFDKLVSIDGPSFERSRVQGHGLTLRWDIAEHMQLKSISAYRTLIWDDGLDLDGSPLPMAHTQRLSYYDSKSEDLQLVGSTGPVKYVAGLYYFKDEGRTNNPQTYFFGTFNFDSRYGFGTEAWASYGQLDWSATDRLTVTGGLRYTSERKSLTRQLGVNFAPGTPFIPLIPAGTSASKTFDAVTPLLTFAWKFNNQVNSYLKFSEGFKSGGFNGEFGDTSDANGLASATVVAHNIAETRTPFNPEKDKSVELGLKATLAGGRLTLNGDAFYNKVTDQQVAIFVATGAASSVIRNAGKATVEGIELEATWLPVDALRLQLSYGYLHSKYDEFIDAGFNAANNRAFVHAPRNTLNLVAEGRVASTPAGKVMLGADYGWTDKFYTYPFPLVANYPGDTQSNPAVASYAGDTQIKASGLLNAHLSLREIPLGQSQGEVTLYGRNVTNESHIANNIDFGPVFGHLTQAYWGEPRTYGLQLRVKF